MLDVWPHLLLLRRRHCLGLPQTVIRCRPLEHGRRISCHDRRKPYSSAISSPLSMFRKGNRPSFLQTLMPLSSMSRTMSITQEPNTLTPVIILYFMLSIPVMWIYVIFPLHLRQPISSLNLLVRSNTKKPSSFYSYTTPATPSDRFISTSISSCVLRTAYHLPTSCPRIRYFLRLHHIGETLRHHHSLDFMLKCLETSCFLFRSGFLVAKFKKKHISVLEGSFYRS